MAIRVQIIDNSSETRNALVDLLSAQTDLEVCAMAHEGENCSNHDLQQPPDILILSAELPRMEALLLLEKAVKVNPLPAILLYGDAETSTHLALNALELGAVDCLPKADLLSRPESIIDQIRQAAGVRLQLHSGEGGFSPAQRVIDGTWSPAGRDDPAAPTGTGVVVIGAATGSVPSIKRILSLAPAFCPPIVISGTMPEPFMALLAKRLDSSCAIRVKIAVEGEPIEAGHAYLAPASSSPILTDEDGQTLIRLSQGTSVRARPAANPIDQLFQTAARCAGDSAIGIILSGQGNDGGVGMLAMQRVGGITIAQAPGSCLCPEMPRAAIQMGGVAHVVHGEGIGYHLQHTLAARLDLQPDGQAPERLPPGTTVYRP